MEHTEKNIELLYQYIDGELNAKEALYVEQQLVQNEEWQTVYEGLVFAENESIDIESSLKRIDTKIQKKQTAQQKPSFTIGLRKFMSAAAAIAGFILLSYAAVKVINSSFDSPQKTSSNTYSSPSDFHIEDQIQIIPPVKAKKVKQNFDAKKAEAFVAEYNEDFLVMEEAIIQKIEPELQNKQAKRVDFAQLDSPLQQPGSYKTLLDRYGYIEVIQPNLLNTPRGANSNEPPRDHFKRFNQNALSDDNLSQFKKRQAEYIARFPFNDKVSVRFEINQEGKAENFKVLAGNDKDAIEIVKKLFFERANWQIPKDINGKPTSQEINSMVSFGNTIIIDIEMEE